MPCTAIKNSWNQTSPIQCRKENCSACLVSARRMHRGGRAHVTPPPPPLPQTSVPPVQSYTMPDRTPILLFWPPTNMHTRTYRYFLYTSLERHTRHTHQQWGPRAPTCYFQLREGCLERHTGAHISILVLRLIGRLGVNTHGISSHAPRVCRNHANIKCARLVGPALGFGHSV